MVYLKISELITFIDYFTLTERIPPEPIGIHEKRITKTATTYAVPLLRAVWRKWANQEFVDGGKRGWLVCSPTSVAKSRILNAKADVPIRLRDMDWH